MTNQQILEKAIKKAIDGGWKSDYEGFELLPNDRLGMIKWHYWFDLGNEQQRNVVYSSYNDILFDKDFAKSLWGDTQGENIKLNGDGSWSPLDRRNTAIFRAIPNWQYHLQQLVIADDVFKYLEENI